MAFTATQLTDIRRFCGYAAYAAFGYVLSPDMATLDTQCANMGATEQLVVTGNYLPVLYSLESAINNALTNIGTDVAAVWTRNKQEFADRVAAFNYWRMRLVTFIGCVPGPDLGGGGGRLIRT
jgi:hypothetical protein